MVERAGFGMAGGQAAQVGVKTACEHVPGDEVVVTEIAVALALAEGIQHGIEKQQGLGQGGAGSLEPQGGDQGEMTSAMMARVAASASS